ncbi:MAG: hypothetical protein K8F91_23725, partial [Candidatus Obscuribacterales bacterium]|nr:hypothetical protein [Candidatus Obscuribacterales bacterium]
IQMGFEAAGKAPKAAIDGTINDLIENKKSPVFPYRGLEDSKLTECTKDNPKAWTDAMAAIPVLKQSGLTSDHLRAVIRNELHFYDPRDIQDDDNAKAGEKSTGTLGYAQITPKGITEFVRVVPEFKDFIKDKGYEVPDDENKILEDPGCVPMIVAAKMASLIKNYQMHNQKHPDNPVAINPRSLIYGYNADVQRVNQNGKITFESMTDREADFKRALKYDLQKVHPSSDPRILDASNHLRHVLQQLNAIQKSR